MLAAMEMILISNDFYFSNEVRDLWTLMSECYRSAILRELIPEHLIHEETGYSLFGYPVCIFIARNTL